MLRKFVMYLYDEYDAFAFHKLASQVYRELTAGGNRGSSKGLPVDTDFSSILWSSGTVGSGIPSAVEWFVMRVLFLRFSISSPGECI